jgi:sulfotransferase family protein
MSGWAVSRSGRSGPPRLPDFLIVGAMKSGSSTLVELLNRHRDLSLPSGELYFFSEKFDRGIDWYGEQLRRRTVPARLLGEKCVSYGYIPEAASRIAHTLPAAKLVWILRDPVQRTYANYMHNRRNGIETLPFRAALEREAAGRARSRYTAYVARSCYAREIERFQELFPPARIHVLLFEELLARPMERLGGLFDFLGVETDGYEYRPVHRNAGRSPRFPFPVRLAGTCFGMGSKIHRRVRELCTTAGPYPRLGEDDEAYLREVLREPNAQLAALLGRDLAAWDAPRDLPPSGNS